jgi:hypothetical protein
MINAAVPMEAYDPSVLDQKGPGSAYEAMTESGWKGKVNHIFASNWHQGFDADNDSRGKLAWKGLFGKITLRPGVVNFYSSGEDVVENPKSSSSLVILDMITNFDTAKGAWGHQEMIKGSAGAGGLAFSRVQGGWWRRSNFDDPVVSVDVLRTNPRFRLFLEGDLFSEDAGTGSIKASESRVLYDVLARGIPALSYAAAANPVPAFTPSRNFDMESSGRVEKGKEADGNTIFEWPTEGHDDEYRANRWNHSDLKNVALPYVHKMYQNMLTQGELTSP